DLSPLSLHDALPIWATRTQFRALGVTPPQHLLIVVQRTVVDGDRPLASLLQVFEQPGGDRRHVLFLALAVGEESMSDARGRSPRSEEHTSELQSREK